MEEPEGTINEPERINFSAVEGVAYHLGTLKICSEIERNFLDGDWEAEGRQWSGVRKALLALVEFLNLDESLKSFAPKDPFVENGIRERSKSDPRCFNTTADWLFRLRKDRGTVIQLEDIDLPDIDGHAHFSTLENLARVYGMIDILQANEQFVLSGAMPRQTFILLVFKMLNDKLCGSIVLFLEQFGCKDEVLPPGNSDDPTNDRTLILDQLRTRTDLFMVMEGHFRRGYDQLSAKVGKYYIEDHVDAYLRKYTSSEPRFKAQAILFTLLNRLQARSEAVERFEYHRLETIDGNSKHLLTTLEQYGIKASTYDQALEQFEKRYGREDRESLGQDRLDKIQRDVAKIERDIQSRIRNRTDVEEYCRRLEESCNSTVATAEQEDKQFIRFQYQKFIDKARKDGRV